MAAATKLHQNSEQLKKKTNQKSIYEFVSNLTPSTLKWPFLGSWMMAILGLELTLRRGFTE